MPYEIRQDVYNLAFSEGEFTDFDADIKFYRKSLGQLAISSNAIAAYDPMLEDEPERFDFDFPNGNFDVDVAVAVFGGSDERVAFASIIFSANEVANWEMATTLGRKAEQLTREDSWFGYIVDSGVGGFSDFLIAQKHCQSGHQKMDLIDDKMAPTYRPTWAWANFKPLAHESENIICFYSGIGDGMYPSFLGFDQNGEIAVLVTDFMIVPDEHWAPNPFKSVPSFFRFIGWSIKDRVKSIRDEIEIINNRGYF